MPIPAPRGKESKDDFISRCISTLSDKGEFDSQDQRVAVCFDAWRDAKENKLMKKIRVKEEFQLPGTSIILEKGDVILIEQDSPLNQDTEAEVRGMLQSKKEAVDMIMDLIGRDTFNEDTKSEIVGLLKSDSDRNDMIMDLLGL